MSWPARVHALIHRAKQFFDGVRRTVVISRAAAVSRGFPKVELSRASGANPFPITSQLPTGCGISSVATLLIPLRSEASDESLCIITERTPTGFGISAAAALLIPPQLPSAVPFSLTRVTLDTSLQAIREGCDGLMGGHKWCGRGGNRRQRGHSCRSRGGDPGEILRIR